MTTNRELPENVTQWPRDPFQLIGVTKDVDPKEFKRTYTRLIKRFKPEQFPEQFRLLREAYDQIQQFLQYRQIYEQHHEADSRDPSFDTNVNLDNSEISKAPDPGCALSLNVQDSPAGQEILSETKLVEDKPLRKPSVIQEHQVVLSPIEQAIRLAISGDSLTAISLLRKNRARLESVNGNEAVQALEYWIAKLSKQDQPSLNPRTIIRGQLESGNLSESAVENAKLELAKDPTLLCDYPLAQLFAKSCQQHDYFLYARWQSAHRTGNFKLIMEDCCWLNDYYFDDLVRWLYLSYQAVQHLLWSEDLEVVQYGMQLVKQLNDEHLSLPEFVSDLTRLDFLLNTTMCLYEYLKKPDSIRSYWKLMGICWNSIEPDCREMLILWMSNLSSNLSKELAALDAMFRLQPQLIEILVRKCLLICRNGMDQTDDDEKVVLDSTTELTIRRFLSQLESTDYTKSRMKILQFSITTSINPHLIHRAIELGRSKVYTPFAPLFRQKISSDYVAVSVFRIVKQIDRLVC